MTDYSRTSDHRCDDCGGHQVLSVAIWHKDGLVYSLPRPARHHDVIRAMVDSGVPAPIGPAQGYTQGFLTQWGLKDRELAGRLIGHKGLLTSEDLW